MFVASFEPDGRKTKCERSDRAPTQSSRREGPQRSDLLHNLLRQSGHAGRVAVVARFCSEPDRRLTSRALQRGFFSRSVRDTRSAGLTSPGSRRSQPTGSKEEHLDDPHHKMVIANSIASASRAAWRCPRSLCRFQEPHPRSPATVCSS